MGDLEAKDFCLFFHAMKILRLICDKNNMARGRKKNRQTNNGNPLTRPEPDKESPVEEPPEPVLVPPERDEPEPMKASIPHD